MTPEERAARAMNALAPYDHPHLGDAIAAAVRDAIAAERERIAAAVQDWRPPEVQPEAPWEAQVAAFIREGAAS